MFSRVHTHKFAKLYNDSWQLAWQLLNHKKVSVQSRKAAAVEWCKKLLTAANPS
jgi:hypothetical protein